MEQKNVEYGWSMLLKFGTEENLKKLQSGQLYMKNLQYYVNLEKSTQDEDVGDKYDGQMMFNDVKISMFSYDTHEFIRQFHAPVASLDLGYLKCPVFCMFMIDYRNHISESLDNKTLKVRYEFTEEQVKKLPNFGESVLLIKNGNEFVKRVKQGLLAENIGFTRDIVQYYGSNNLENIKQVTSNNSRIAFWKREKYAYQQEYRFIAHTEVDDYLIVNIGDISDISNIVNTRDMLGTYLEISFAVTENK